MGYNNNQVENVQDGASKKSLPVDDFAQVKHQDGKKTNKNANKKLQKKQMQGLSNDNSDTPTSFLEVAKNDVDTAVISSTSEPIKFEENNKSNATSTIESTKAATKDQLNRISSLATQKTEELKDVGRKYVPIIKDAASSAETKAIEVMAAAKNKTKEVYEDFATTKNVSKEEKFTNIDDQHNTTKTSITQPENTFSLAKQLFEGSVNESVNNDSIKKEDKIKASETVKSAQQTTEQSLNKAAESVGTSIELVKKAAQNNVDAATNKLAKLKDSALEKASLAINEAKELTIAVAPISTETAVKGKDVIGEKVNDAILMAGSVTKRAQQDAKSAIDYTTTKAQDTFEYARNNSTQVPSSIGQTVNKAKESIHNNVQAVIEQGSDVANHASNKRKVLNKVVIKNSDNSAASKSIKTDNNVNTKGRSVEKAQKSTEEALHCLSGMVANILAASQQQTGNMLNGTIQTVQQVHGNASNLVGSTINATTETTGNIVKGTVSNVQSLVINIGSVVGII